MFGGVIEGERHMGREGERVKIEMLKKLFFHWFCLFTIFSGSEKNLIYGF